MLVILETPKVALGKKNQADILLLEIRPFKNLMLITLLFAYIIKNVLR